MKRDLHLEICQFFLPSTLSKCPSSWYSLLSAGHIHRAILIFTVFAKKITLKKIFLLKHCYLEFEILGTCGYPLHLFLCAVT